MKEMMMRPPTISLLGVLLGPLMVPECTPYLLPQLLLPRHQSTSTVTTVQFPAQYGRSRDSRTRLWQNEDDLSSSTSASSSILDQETTNQAQQQFQPQQQQQQAAPSPFQPDLIAYASGYKTAFTELPFQVCRPNVGTIPKDLVGTYFRSGPAMFSAGSIVPPKTSLVRPRQPPVPDGQDMERMVRHPMEGDGAVFAITFHGGAVIGAPEKQEQGPEQPQASARFRFVRTVGFTSERKKGARIYKGMDATRAGTIDEKSSYFLRHLANDMPLPLIRHHLQPGLNKQRKNTSNTRAIYWGDRLFSLWEGGQPYKLDARALDTEGRSRLGGALRRDDDPFGAKLSYDSLRNRAVFYGIEHGPMSTDVTLYEFDDNFALIDRTLTSLSGFASIHDFAITPNFALFIQPAIQVNGMQYLLNKDPAKCLQCQGKNQPGTLHLVPRTGSKMAQVSFRLPAVGPSETNVHFVNAFEEGPTVIVDVILCDHTSKQTTTATRATYSLKSWPWATSLDEYQTIASKQSLWRYTIHVASGQVDKTLLLDNHVMFGTINPSMSSQKHRYIYTNVGALGCAVAPPQGILRYDTVTGDVVQWMPKPYEFCGEPMFAPHHGATDSAEDGGYILSLLYNGQAETSEVILLHADANLAEGPIARIPLNIAIPHGLFGCFAQNAVWPSDSLERRAKLADKVESRGNRWNQVKSDFSGLGLRLDDMEEYFGDFFN